MVGILKQTAAGAAQAGDDEDGDEAEGGDGDDAKLQDSAGSDSEADSDADASESGLLQMLAERLTPSSRCNTVPTGARCLSALQKRRVILVVKVQGRLPLLCLSQHPCLAMGQKSFGVQPPRTLLYQLVTAAPPSQTPTGCAVTGADESESEDNDEEDKAGAANGIAAQADGQVSNVVCELLHCLISLCMETVASICNALPTGRWDVPNIVL